MTCAMVTETLDDFVDGCLDASPARAVADDGLPDLLLGWDTASGINLRILFGGTP